MKNIVLMSAAVNAFKLETDAHIPIVKASEQGSDEWIVSSFQELNKGFTDAFYKSHETQAQTNCLNEETTSNIEHMLSDPWDSEHTINMFV